MKEQVEIELKTLVSKDQFEKLCSFYEPLEFVEQINTYFITDDMKHYAFRIRERKGEKLFTLKQKINGMTVEHEKVFTGNFFDDEEIRKTLDSFAIHSPYRILGCLITQRAVVNTELAELCFDINSYNGLVDYEIEYEAKREHDYQTAFQKILDQADIVYRPSWGSKYRRCCESSHH